MSFRTLPLIDDRGLAIMSFVPVSERTCATERLYIVNTDVSVFGVSVATGTLREHPGAGESYLLSSVVNAREDDPALEPARRGLAQLLKRVPGGLVGLDRSPALLTARRCSSQRRSSSEESSPATKATRCSSGHVTVYVLFDQGRYALATAEHRR